MRIVDDLKMTAKLAAANDKDGISLLCLRAIGVIEDFSRASRDLCEAQAPCDIVAAKDRLNAVIRDSSSV